MASFYHLFNRFLAEKAKGEKLYVFVTYTATGTRFSLPLRVK